MSVLTDGDFELDGYVLGGGVGRPVYLQTIETGTVDVRDQDVDNPYGNNRRFGRDERTAPTWVLRVGMDDNFGESDVLEALEDIHTQWSRDYTAGEVSVLRYALKGRTRVAYGRARRFYSDPNTLFDGSEYAVGQGEFVLQAPYVYADELQTIRIDLVQPSTGGMVFPVTFPVTTIPPDERQGTVDQVGGRAPAPFLAVIHGPINDPYLLGNGWELRLSGSLAYDQWIELDTRNMTALRNDGTNVSGWLGRRSRLSKAKLAPGQAGLTFGGSDATGTAYCEISWRSTFNAI